MWDDDKGAFGRVVRGAAVVLLLATATADAVNAGSPALEDEAGQFRTLYVRPLEIPFPDDNRYTPAKAELGKILFFDPRLSRVGALSCASCHNPSFGWEDGRPFAIGDNMLAVRRHSPTVLNAAWGSAFFWDGRSWTLEHQAIGPITSPVEMNVSAEDLVARLGEIEAYRRRFAAVFPGEGVSADNVAKAIATFERTIVSADAPFDLWVQGKADAIGDDAKAGFVLFNTTARCSACHAGWRFTNDSFHDIGLPGTADLGRGELFPATPELGRTFKTPTLRNVAHRQPFMHDGSIATLAAVIEHYATGIVERETISPELPRITLAAAEKAQLGAFLATLTSEDPPMPVPNLP